MVYESKYRPTYSDELYHYGIPGMKWGVHKTLAKAAYQGAKGHFKATGKSMAKKAAYAAAGSVAGAMVAQALKNKKLASYDKKTTSKYGKKIAKKVGTLDSSYNKNNAIYDYRTYGKNGVKRINKSLNKGDSYNKAVAKETGRKVVTDALKTAGKTAITGAVIGAAAQAGKWYLQNRQNQANNVLALPASMVIDAVSYKVIR